MGPRGQLWTDSKTSAVRVVEERGADSEPEADNGKDIVTLYVKPENTAVC